MTDTIKQDGASPMMERIARAMAKARGLDPDYCVLGTAWVGEGGGGTICHRRAWEDELPAARAAVEAMRKPTNDMIAAPRHYDGTESDRQAITMVWQSMIEAILTTQP